MIGKAIRLTAEGQTVMARAARQVRDSAGAELPVVEHTPRSLEHWARTVREMNSGREILMLVRADSQEQYDELLQVRDELLAAREVAEQESNRRDLDEAAYML